MGVRLLVAGAVLFGVAAPANAERVGGLVLAAQSHWDGRGRIVTELVVELPDGTTTLADHTGGTVDGITMWTSLSPVAPAPGDLVELRPGAGRQRRTATSPVAAIDGEIPHRGTAGQCFSRQYDLGAEVAWAAHCAEVVFDEAGTTHLPGDLEFDLFRQAMQAWHGAIQGCSGFQFVETEVELRGAALDGVNVVTFVAEGWEYGPGAQAVTDYYAVRDPENPRYGELLDADIRINAESVRIVHYDDQGGLVSDGPAGLPSFDLLNTATHEFGHMLGLGHTGCIGMTMETFQESGETSKRTPESGDIEGACTIYPLAEAPSGCTPVDFDPSLVSGSPSQAPAPLAGGCATTGRQQSRFPECLVALLCVLALRRRCRSYRCR